MGSEIVGRLKILINQKMKYEKILSICEGLHSVTFIMLLFYVLTHRSGYFFYLIGWSFLAILGWVVTHSLEKKIILIKKNISDELFEEE